LGAALATLAGTDAILSNWIPSGANALMYNYGSPRVGNYEYSS